MGGGQRRFRLIQAANPFVEHGGSLESHGNSGDQGKEHGTLGLDFGRHPDVIFKKAPLVVVLCQIKFEPIFSLLSEVGVAGFQEGIREKYPSARREEATQFHVSRQPSNSIGVRQSPPIWRLSDKQDDWQWRVSLAVDFIALEAPKYVDFGEFLSRMRFLLEVLDRTIHPGDATRIGLRKINQFEHPNVRGPKDWTKLLRPELISLAGCELPGELHLSMSEVRIKDGKRELAIRHGVPPESSMRPGGQESTDRTSSGGGPAEAGQLDGVASLSYVLDLDYSTFIPLTVRDDSAITGLLQEFSDSMTSFFHWSLGPEMHKWLEPIPRDEATK